MPQNPRSEGVPRGYGSFSLPPGADEKLAAYEELVARWAPRLDLVAPGDLDRLGERHIADSLKALPLLERLGPGDAVDVGSGAGLPGIPLALAVPARRWTLLEPRRARAGFLEEAVRVLELDAEVLVAGAEEVAAAGRRWAVATARALAPPPRAFALLAPLLTAEGTAIVWVGSDALLPANSALGKEGLATMPARPPS